MNWENVNKISCSFKTNFPIHRNGHASTRKTWTENIFFSVEYSLCMWRVNPCDCFSLYIEKNLLSIRKMLQKKVATWVSKSISARWFLHSSFDSHCSNEGALFSWIMSMVVKVVETGNNSLELPLTDWKRKAIEKTEMPYEGFKDASRWESLKSSL